MTQNWYALSAIALAIGGMILGGASSQGLLGNALVQMMAALLLAWTLVRARAERRASNSGFGTSVALVLGFVALIQFLPLPPAVWSRLPGRSEIVEGFVLLNQPLPWLTLSLSPWQSLASLTWWLPMIAVFFAVRDSRGPSFRVLAMTIISAAMFSAALGIMQISTGLPYLYAITNYGLPVGVFANANHQASFLLAAIAMCAGLYSQSNYHQGKVSKKSLGSLVFVGIAGFLALGVVLSGSLAGTMLLAIAVAGVAPILDDGWRPKKWLVIAVALAILTLLGVAHILGLKSLGLVDTEIRGIGRADIWTTGLRAAWEFFPVGSGLGTFESVYHWFEAPDEVTTTYVNHAHNDLLELIIETGVFGLVAGVLCALWFGRRLLRFKAASSVTKSVGLVVVIFALHSLVDYPLRTAACSIAFAIALGLLARDPDTFVSNDRPSSKRGGRRVRRA